MLGGVARAPALYMDDTVRISLVAREGNEGKGWETYVVETFTAGIVTLRKHRILGLAAQRDVNEGEVEVGTPRGNELGLPHDGVGANVVPEAGRTGIGGES